MHPGRIPISGVLGLPKRRRRRTGFGQQNFDNLAEVRFLQQGAVTGDDTTLAVQKQRIWKNLQTAVSPPTAAVPSSTG